MNGKRNDDNVLCKDIYHTMLKLSSSYFFSSYLKKYLNVPRKDVRFTIPVQTVFYDFMFFEQWTSSNHNHFIFLISKLGVM